MRVLEEVAISAMGKMVMSMTMRHVVGLKTLILRGSGFLFSKAAKVRHRRVLVGVVILGVPCEFPDQHSGDSVHHQESRREVFASETDSKSPSCFLQKMVSSVFVD